ncbi:MAG TPA: hypothetical protein VK775_10650 [Chthoniobacterales bacterium]|nr:hypothetical protein [Chthoniobacterales bacterium]
METERSNPGSPDKPEVSDQPPAMPTRKPRRWRIVVGILVTAVLLFMGIPLVIRAFNTVSTDDAYELDMYGGTHVFEGRIIGLTMGTGSTLALLPAQNATGNFVKVVQRLPVRIDVLNYDPDKLPLFIGLSVTPTVDLRSTPTGPNAGKFLQAPEQAAGSR